LDVSAAVLSDNITRLSANAFQIGADETTIRFDLTPLNLRGRDAGLLRFALSCQNTRAKPLLTIQWTGETEAARGEIQFDVRVGTSIVPVDASPRWLLSKHVQSVTLKIRQARGCSHMTLDNVELLQRLMADEVDKLSVTMD
jgi:hypothetical protein